MKTKLKEEEEGVLEIGEKRTCEGRNKNLEERKTWQLGKKKKKKKKVLKIAIVFGWNCLMSMIFIFFTKKI